jgi:hypothetical protein
MNSTFLPMGSDFNNCELFKKTTNFVKSPIDQDTKLHCSTEEHKQEIKCRIPFQLHCFHFIILRLLQFKVDYNEYKFPEWFILESKKYILKSIIVHRGTTSGGHYFAYCLRNNNWYCFDDKNVTFTGKFSEVYKLTKKTAPNFFMKLMIFKKILVIVHMRF